MSNFIWHIVLVSVSFAAIALVSYGSGHRQGYHHGLRDSGVVRKNLIKDQIQ